MSIEKLKKLEKQIEELKARWPAHSVPPSMYERLEELEEELEKLESTKSFSLPNKKLVEKNPKNMECKNDL